MAEILRSLVGKGSLSHYLQGFSTIPTVLNRLGISEPFPIWTPSCLPPLRVNSRHQLYTRLNDEEGGLWGGSFLVTKLRKKTPNHHCFDWNFSPSFFGRLKPQNRGRSQVPGIYTRWFATQPFFIFHSNKLETIHFDGAHIFF